MKHTTKYCALLCAGLAVAVENASSEAKAAADVICPACNAGGVAWVLNNLA